MRRFETRYRVFTLPQNRLGGKPRSGEVPLPADSA